MEQIITRQEFDDLMKIKAEVRGSGPRNIGLFILKGKGKEALERLEKIITNLGYPIKYEKLRPMSFYPFGLVAVSLLAIKRLFNYDNKEFQEMGGADAKFSPITKIFLKHFVSVKRVAKAAPRMWKKYNAGGNLKVINYDEDKKYAILRVENFCIHPLHCQYLIGYFSSVIQMIVGKKGVCEETKCVHRGHDHHEFLLKW